MADIGAELHIPRQGDPESIRSFTAMFDDSGPGAWVADRRRCGESLEPRMFYRFGDDDHTVAWVQHIGVVSSDNTYEYEEKGQPYKLHHVVCDCATIHTVNNELPDDDDYSEDVLSRSFTLARPDRYIACEWVDYVLDQRARELAQQQRLLEMLMTPVGLDDTGRLSSAGEALAIEALRTLFQTDIRYPDRWMANPRNGIHRVSILPVFLGLNSEDVKSVLEMMESARMIEVDEQTVTLAQAA